MSRSPIRHPADSRWHRAGRDAPRPQARRPSQSDRRSCRHRRRCAAPTMARMPPRRLRRSGAHGFELELVQKGLRTFRASPHRMEEVGRRGKVLFINDSKATNADAAEKALLSLDDIYWIIGGRAKEGGIGPLMPLFPRVAKAYLIGEATELLRQDDRRSVLMNFAARSNVAVDARRGMRRRARRLRARRPALAGLRLVRSVPEFREARRQFRGCSGQARGAKPKALRGLEIMVSRVERSALAELVVDRRSLASRRARRTCHRLGLVLTMAASPPVAERLGLPTFHFVNRQVLLLVPSLAVLFADLAFSRRGMCAAPRSSFSSFRWR